MSMNSQNSTNQRHAIRVAAAARQGASHGDFFFAEWALSDGTTRKSPCYVISDHQDPHNEIIVLKVTSQPSRTDFDIPVSCLREPTSLVRTNKVYTILRNQLLFPIQAQLNPQEYLNIITKLKEAINV